jgi:methylmalonyl-CoA/ethylmalonyl-CoA epimerase
MTSHLSPLQNAGVLALDHVAFGVASIADVSATVCRRLGGRPHSSGPGIGFSGAQWELAGGGRVEAIEPEGQTGGFLHRFLDARGPGVHHVTFKVRDIHHAAAAATAAGYEVVGLNDGLASWKEMFLHPKQALGVVVQLAESHPELGDDGWTSAWPYPRAAVEEHNRPAVIGLRLRARSATAARRQWAELLGARVQEAGALLIFTWPGSPLRISVEVADTDAEGPVAIEISTPAGAPSVESKIDTLGCRLLSVVA